MEGEIKIIELLLPTIAIDLLMGAFNSEVQESEH